MRKLLVILSPVAVIALGVGGFVMMHAFRPAPEIAAQSEPQTPKAFVEEVRSQSVTLTVATQGEVEAVREIDLVPQVTGRIDSVAPSFVRGGTFKKGDVLVQVERADYEWAATQAESTVADARLALAQEEARAEVARRQWQWEGITDTPTPLALKEPHVAQARARLASAEAQLARARRDLQRTTIRAPFNGRIRTKSVDAGQFVNAGTVLGQAFSTEVVQIRLPLTDRQLGDAGLPVAFAAATYEDGPRVTLKAALAGAERRWQGRIVRTDAAIDSETRLLFAFAEIRDPYGAAADDGIPLPVGLFVTAEIAGRSMKDALVIPRAALRETDTVLIVNAENTLQVRTVEVISTSTDRAVIGAGLRPGDLVVTSPLGNPVDGMTVEPMRRETARLAQLGPDSLQGDVR